MAKSIGGWPGLPITVRPITVAVEVGARNVLDHRLECRARRQRDPLADHRGARHRVGRRGGDEREAYLSTPLFEGIPEGMTEEEQAISLSTPSAQMAAE